ncbi:hypothetical protein FNF27_05515 [Cafeteria roenbergensis]|uniref:Homeobox domain-containing protein n=1 Tax=Cafeteria roenbergensis TaxID=33653 RepID=A0A5A8DVS1_CAFRO|nr:hypothetical protein FNF28_01997 [Cafeteria roenbergensis]KAA0173024.1 hypothetical protein FNF27_05515 [Cafeteria roenbergensis]
MASESGPEEDSGVVAVFQGGVAQTGQCTFIAELNTTKPVHLGVANDLWDAIELFVAGLRHCQSMLRGDNTVTMDSVTRSLEDTVAHGGLQRAVEASLALQARAHKQAAHHRGPGGPTAAFTDPFGASRRPAFSRPAVAASFGGAMASYSLANASGAEEGGWGSTPGHGALASDGMGLPALDGMHSDLSDGGGGPLGVGLGSLSLGAPARHDDAGNSAAVALATLASSGRRKRASDLSASDAAGALSDGTTTHAASASASGRGSAGADDDDDDDGDADDDDGDADDDDDDDDDHDGATPAARGGGPGAAHRVPSSPAGASRGRSSPSAKRVAGGKGPQSSTTRPRQSRTQRGSFVSSMAKRPLLDASVQLDPSTGRSVVCFGVPEGYMDVQNYDEKTSGRLPADTTKALKQWMVDHWSSPYPQEAEKATMAGESGMTLQQVSNWFRNERKRIWLPLKRRAEQLLAPELAERKRA